MIEVFLSHKHLIYFAHIFLIIYSYYRESCRSLVASQQSFCVYLNAPPIGATHTEQCGTILLKHCFE